MTNEIEQYSPAELVTTDGFLDASDKALERIEKQARTMNAAHKLGSALARTAMVPEIYQQFPENKKENPAAADNATAAILYGAELGFSAVQSLQNIFIVRGKPAIYSRAMVAQVIAAGHRVEEVEASPESVTWRGRRADTGAEFTSTWTIERAKMAGFLSNKLYTSIPTEMLRAKCQAEVCRTMAPDVLLGMAHSVEDLQLADAPIRATAERVQGPKRGTAGLAEALGVKTEPAPLPAADPTPEVATPDELKALTEALKAADITDVAEIKSFLSGRIGRDLGTMKELTSLEVAAVLDFIENGEPA
jgi:hypothetical protein